MYVAAGRCAGITAVEGFLVSEKNATERPFTVNLTYAKIFQNSLPRPDIVFIALLFYVSLIVSAIRKACRHEEYELATCRCFADDWPLVQSFSVGETTEYRCL